MAQLCGKTCVHVGLHLYLRDELLEKCALIDARIAEHLRDDHVIHLGLALIIALMVVQGSKAIVIRIELELAVNPFVNFLHVLIFARWRLHSLHELLFETFDTAVVVRKVPSIEQRLFLEVHLLLELLSRGLLAVFTLHSICAAVIE